MILMIFRSRAGFASMRYIYRASGSRRISNLRELEAR